MGCSDGAPPGAAVVGMRLGGKACATSPTPRTGGHEPRAQVAVALREVSSGEVLRTGLCLNNRSRRRELLKLPAPYPALLLVRNAIISGSPFSGAAFYFGLGQVLENGAQVRLINYHAGGGLDGWPVRIESDA